MRRFLERLIAMAPSASSPAFVHHAVPNRSLGPRGRRWFLAAVAATTLGPGLGALAFGAWPVLPFAGLEVALVWLAVRAIGRHDGDFERLEIDAGEVRFFARHAARETSFVASSAWARVVVEERGARCALALRYAGRTVPVGRLLSDEGRRELAHAVRGRIAVAAERG
jgi:uncharacterized membrane protein